MGRKSIKDLFFKGLGVMFLFSILITGPATYGQTLIWTQKNVDSFCDSNNLAVSGFTVYDDHIYVGTFNEGAGGEVWRYDGTSWSQIDTSVLGTCDGILVGPVYKDSLYAGTSSGEVWQYNGTVWAPVDPDRFIDASNEICSMGVYENCLYVGTCKENIGWCEVWKYNGSTWTQVNSDGFGDANNEEANGLVECNGYLYAGVTNEYTGCEVWQYNGTTWDQVNTDGFGEGSCQADARGMACYNGHLYVGTENKSSGCEVWKYDGSAWTQVSTGGFGDPNNEEAIGMAVYNNYLFVGTEKSNQTGAEVWRYNGSIWTQVNTDGFGDPNNSIAIDMGIYNDCLYVGTLNEHTGAEVWMLGAKVFYIHEWGHDANTHDNYTSIVKATFDDLGGFTGETIKHSETDCDPNEGTYTISGSYTISNGVINVNLLDPNQRDNEFRISPDGEKIAGATAQLPTSGINYNEVLRIGIKDSSLNSINGTYYIFGWGNKDIDNFTVTYLKKIIFDGSEGYTSETIYDSEEDCDPNKETYTISGTYTISNGFVTLLDGDEEFLIRISPDGETLAGITVDPNNENLIAGVKEAPLSNINGTYYGFGWGHEDDSNNHTSYTCTFTNKMVFDGSGGFISDNINDSQGHDLEPRTGNYNISEDGFVEFSLSFIDPNDEPDKGKILIAPDGETFLGITTQPDNENLLIGVKDYTEINIPKGWSMISLPVAPPDAKVSTLFPEAVVIYGFDRESGYVRVKEDEDLQVGSGYWILVNEDQSYVLTGQPILSYSKTVYSNGWEMIGGTSYPSHISVEKGDFVVVYRYVQGVGYQRVQQGENLQPGKGYWILLKDVMDQCELTIGLPFTGTFKYEETYEASYCKSGGLPFDCTVNDWNIIYLKLDGNSLTGKVFEIDTVENCCTATSTVPITGTIINETTAILSAPANEMKCEGKCNGGENCIYEHEENYNYGPKILTVTLEDNGNILRIHDDENTVFIRQENNSSIIDVAGIWTWVEEQSEVFSDPNSCHEIGYKDAFTVTITQNEDQITFSFDIDDIEDIENVTEFSMTGSITGNIISANGTLQLSGEVSLEFTAILAVSENGETLTGTLSQNSSSPDYCTGTFKINATYGQIITGIAAAGAPIVGIVNLKDANGETASSPIEIDGSYSIDVSGLTAPFILFAEGSVNGKGIKIYSAAVALGNINITPITDFILRNAYRGDPEDAYIDWASSQVSEDDLNAAEFKVQEKLAPLLSATGLSDDIDLISTPFDTDLTGMDMLLEVIDISYQGNVATVTNNWTGSQYTDDITDPSYYGNGLPASDEDVSRQVVSDQNAINLFWQGLEDLYATKPTDQDIIDWIEANMADDFLGEGESKTFVKNYWINEDGPEVGITFSVMIIEPMDANSINYEKGYWIRIYETTSTESDQFLDSMVFDGTNWLWYGDRRLLSVNADTHAFMYVMNEDQRTFSTGFELSLCDDNNYAYNQGVRSAIVTGPGLPASGVVYEHKFPKTCFEIYQSGGCFYAISDDSLVSAIPDNAEYTFTLCSDSAADLYNGDANCSMLQVYTDSIMKSPLLKSHLNASMFATLTDPNSHSAAEWNFGDKISVSWTIPENTVSKNVHLTWLASSVQYEVSEENDEGGNTVILDTIGLPAPDGWAGLFIRIEDRYERDFNMGWGLYK